MVPMLFMGEEWGSTAPFPFFCDFHGDLAEAVREGRRREFAGAYARYGDEIPDPLEPSTVQSAALDWAARDAEPGRKRLALVRELLAIRRREIVPRLAGARFGEAHAADNGLLTARLAHGRRRNALADGQLSERETALASAESRELRIWGSEPPRACPPWSVFWASDSHDAADHSDRDLPAAIHRGFRFRCRRGRRALSEGARHHAISTPRRS